MDSRKDIKEACKSIQENDDYTYESVKRMGHILEANSYEAEWDRNLSVKIKEKLEKWKISGPDRDVKGFIKEFVVALTKL